jgi:hypothetical protein
MTDRDDPRAQERSESEALAATRAPAPAAVEVYESPAIIDLGSVRELTRGSAKNGSCDATNQYYN